MQGLAAWYPQLKLAHVALVAASGALFSLRALGALAGARWPLAPAPRIASVAVDTLLLAAGVALWFALRLDLGHAPWLAAKLSLLVLYILLGIAALHRDAGRVGRVAALLGAWTVFATMVSIALTRDPLGGWRFLVPA